MWIPNKDWRNLPNQSKRRVKARLHTILHHVSVLPRGLRVAESGPLDQIPIDIHVRRHVRVALDRGLLVQNAFHAHTVGVERVLRAEFVRVLRLELGALSNSENRAWKNHKPWQKKNEAGL